MPPLPFRRLHPDSPILAYSRIGDAGLDLRTIKPITLYSGDTLPIPTGIAVAIPDGFAGLIVGRSGLGSLGVVVLGGLIDRTYRGEIKVILHHVGDDGPLYFEAGDRIAQLVVFPNPTFSPVEVAELDATERGDSGFGSSGA